MPCHVALVPLKKEEKCRPNGLAPKMTKFPPWSRVNQKPINNDLEAAGRQVSVSTVKCVLCQHELRSCCVRTKPLLQKQHLKAWLKFAADHMVKESTLEETLWSHETKTELFDHNEQQYVWRREGEAFNPKNTIPTVMVLEVLCFGADLLL